MLVDPTIIREGDPTSPFDPTRTHNPPLATTALSRRDFWSSRSAAAASLAASAFFGRWDQRVLDAYVAFGLVPLSASSSNPENVDETEDTPVTLAMPVLQEALVYEGAHRSAQVWDLFSEIDPRIPLRFVFPGKQEPVIGGPQSDQERAWLRPENSSNIKIPGVGHLIVQEAPTELVLSYPLLVIVRQNPKITHLLLARFFVTPETHIQHVDAVIMMPSLFRAKLPPSRGWRASADTRLVPALASRFPAPAGGITSCAPRIAFPDKSFLDGRYAVSTHIAPATHVRTMRISSPPPPPARSDASRAERAAAATARNHWACVETAQEPGRYERVMWNVVKRYVRRDVSEAGITLFLAGGNGFPKEIWEPTLLDLLSLPDGHPIDEIWAWEAVHHGASASVNATLGPTLVACDGVDDARDILNFLLHFLPSKVAGVGKLATSLPLIPIRETAHRQANGFNQRKLIAVGHSFGGCLCGRVAFTEPRLFAALILVDPVLIRFGTPFDDTPFTRIALARRQTWKSREEALVSFATSPFFATWDARAIHRYVRYALVDCPDGSVRLVMPPEQEALIMEGRVHSGVVWDLIRYLDPCIYIHWVVPGRANELEIGGPMSTRERVWLRPENSSNVRVPKVGHLIVQEAPRELAAEISGALDKVVRWRKIMVPSARL
ncbi:unnamed protein product [Mycena citricolor]|uniref:AB hydrolase-1 domain-containing protein n=1 Tax=Mycena citricolor TaxID=2018698 RepID=A0AAD2K438_9AGAR|nr:unnamed protein product [Mycena citricolor]